jgi:transposase
MGMNKPLVSDELWAVVAPLLPPEPPKSKGGRPRVSDRAALTGIIFVLKSGIPWEMLPQEMGCGSGVTCWRRLRDWQEARVWDRLHRELLDRLGEAGRIDWSRASLDSASIPAKGGAMASVPTRRIVARPGGRPARSAMLWEIAAGSRSPAS